MLRLIGFYMQEDAELNTSAINLKPTFYGSLQIKMFHIGVSVLTFGKRAKFWKAKLLAASELAFGSM